MDNEIEKNYLDKIWWNSVIDLYDRLNVNLMAEIINRVIRMGNVSSMSKKQLKILAQRNGDEIFEYILKNTALIDAELKEELEKVYTKAINENMKDYKPLYDYRGKEFKLTESQLKILNGALKNANETYRNLTNTIAFKGKQDYVNIVDKYFGQVVTGGTDYISAITNAVKELSNKGITLQDSLGREVQLDVAVRRNILTGVKQTADSVNDEIAKYLGCDGVEISATPNCRPSHRKMQGKQFALNHRTKESKKYPLFSEVKDLLNDYGCQHVKKDIILGISEPVYTNKELYKINNRKVSYNGQKIPVYEAYQTQRYIERNIRKQKRAVDNLDNAIKNTKDKEVLKVLQNERDKTKQSLNSYYEKYRDFCNQTKLTRQNERLKV